MVNKSRNALEWGEPYSFKVLLVGFIFKYKVGNHILLDLKLDLGLYISNDIPPKMKYRLFYAISFCSHVSGLKRLPK